MLQVCARAAPPESISSGAPPPPKGHQGSPSPLLVTLCYVYLALHLPVPAQIRSQSLAFAPRPRCRKSRHECRGFGSESPLLATSPIHQFIKSRLGVLRALRKLIKSFHQSSAERLGNFLHKSQEPAPPPQEKTNCDPAPQKHRNTPWSKTPRGRMLL